MNTGWQVFLVSAENSAGQHSTRHSRDPAPQWQWLPAAEPSAPKARTNKALGKPTGLLHKHNAALQGVLNPRITLDPINCDHN